ncbi:TadE/TadG family type IV pilus assembly protein [Arthrobacter sp. H20]|uniref:TadE/TadG family type IV pilus assembly protein n=1 Tax=Arthrobacter sp. H20 TaxID=1267981 RepID=UPI00047BBEED|nr:TadE/TadG family type IV pilus assembly protein [Arthrobacter sp. H20]
MLEDPGGKTTSERGAAVVDFALIGGLLTVIFIALIQLTMVLHVRNTLIDAASSGARYGTLADRSADDAAQRTEAIISAALSDGYAEEISVGEVDRNGMSMLVVTVRAPLPVIGLIGPAGVLEVTGHAVLPRPSID